MGTLVFFASIATVVVAVFLLRRKRNSANLSVLPEKFVVFDLETTGLNPISDEIIEIGAVLVNRNSNSHDTFQSLIKPTSPISKKISGITGISQKMLDSEGEEVSKVLSEFLEFIGNHHLVTYNSKFDMGFLSAALKKDGIDPVRNPVSCALKMARRAWPDLKSYKLVDLAKIAGTSTSGSHRALKDCEITIPVYAAAAVKLGSAK